MAPASLQAAADHRPPAPRGPGVQHVAVLIETSTTWGVEVVRGIGRYVREHADWVMHLDPRGRNEHQLLPEDWAGDGVIARVNHGALAEQLTTLGVPTVNVSWFPFEAPNIYRVTNNELRVGRLAAEHLADRGLQNVAVIPAHDRPGYQDRFTPAVVEEARRRNARVSVFDVDASGFARMRGPARLDALAAWLAGLEKPLGVVAFSDVHARTVIDACRVGGMRVPDEVAVLGGEYDELHSHISLPELSSVHHNGETVGYAAAEVLARILAGDTPPKHTIIPPGEIVTRQSTDMLAVEDAALRAACEFIRRRAKEPIGVEDLARHVAVSRRALERKFKDQLGRTPAELIRQVRLEHASRLLIDTTMSVATIAERTGFGTTDVMTRAFRAKYDQTPTEFRAALASQRP